ncbi:putative disease resistance RPP13-like protein 2 [Hordeum vulgare]|nr:putative disease resistance RPP13-like protein 2 [Hordeum vulgare]
MGVISASLGAMGPLVVKLDKLLQDPPQGCSASVKELLKDVTDMSSCLQQLSEVENPSPPAKCWMNEARDLSYTMEDFIDSLLFVQPANPSLVPDKIQNTRSLGKWFSHVKTLRKRLEWHEQIAATLSEFKEYAQDAIHRHKVYVLPNSNIEGTSSNRVVSAGPILPTPYEENADIVIDGRMNEFINSLANDGDKQLKVVSVLGPACLGKTTLVKVLYHKFGKRYDCKAFIRVSKNPDMKKLLHDILLQLQQQDAPKYYSELELIDDIKYNLQNKRYLLIVDDVWTASVWSIINHAFPKGNHGSRIITTTQAEDVALTCCGYQPDNVFEVKPLDDDHSRKLFFNRLFGSEGNCPDQFKEDSDEIIELCGGLPLATVSIASLLASQPARTTELLRYIHKSLGSCFLASSSSERTRHALNLSFNNLPQYLKTCLLYLGMYPEGYTFCKDDLLKQWIAECLIGITEGQDMEKVAESYIYELIHRRFIQPICINYYNEVLSFTVHDVVHDLIAHKAAEEDFIVAINYNLKNAALYHKARRLTLLFDDARYAKTPKNIIESQVRSLSYFGLFESMPSITEFNHVRVLNLQLSSSYGVSTGLGHYDNPVDLSVISELSRLRYLKIASNLCIKLPDYMGGLHCLETIDIMDAVVVRFGRVAHLPYFLHYLYLSLRAERNVQNWIREMLVLAKLKHLHDLRLTFSSAQFLSRKQHMLLLWDFISGHENLRTIVIACDSSDNITGGASDTIISWDDMAPPPLLQKFEFSLHSGMTFSQIPKWVGKLGNLSILKISVRILEMDSVDILRGLCTLTALSLYVRRTSSKRILFQKSAGFSFLRYLKLRFSTGISWLKFEEDAMPNLLKLKLVFDSTPRIDQYLHGIISIDHMLTLREISVKFGGAAFDLECVMRNFVSNHSKNPTINIPSVEYFADVDGRTKLNQQQHEIMKEGSDVYYKQQPDKIVEDEPDGSYRQQTDEIVEDEIMEEEPDEYYKQQPEEIPHDELDKSYKHQPDKIVDTTADKRSHDSLHAFTLDELISATSNFSAKNLLSKDSFGTTTIYKGTLDSELMVAVTKLTSRSKVDKWLFGYLHMKRHPHLVRLLGYCNHDDHNTLVHEFMSRGSLKHHLLETNLIASLPWLTRLKIAVGAAKGLAFLHESGRQMMEDTGFTTSSILLDSDYTAKLWGFSLVKDCPQCDGMQRPDAWAAKDVHNFGVVLLQLLAGRQSVDTKRLLDCQENYAKRSNSLVSNSISISKSNPKTDYSLGGMEQLHHLMDECLEGKHSLSAAWSAVKIARQCMNSTPEERPRMCDVVDALEPLLSDDRGDQDGQLLARGKPESDKTNLVGVEWFISSKAGGGTEEEEDMKLTKQPADDGEGKPKQKEITGQAKNEGQLLTSDKPEPHVVTPFRIAAKRMNKQHTLVRHFVRSVKSKSKKTNLLQCFITSKAGGTENEKDMKLTKEQAARGKRKPKKANLLRCFISTVSGTTEEEGKPKQTTKQAKNQVQILTNNNDLESNFFEKEDYLSLCTE